jgi:hypothetical protein
MPAKENKWTFGDPETLVYVAAVGIGVPLTMWELWHLGRSTVVAALAALWIPTVVVLLVDIARGFISRWSVGFFFVWVAVVVGGGIYQYVV